MPDRRWHQVDTAMGSLLKQQICKFENTILNACMHHKQEGNAKDKNTGASIKFYQ